MKVFRIKNKSRAGVNTRTYWYEYKNSVIITRRYLIKTRELQAVKGYEVLRIFRGMALIETTIFMKKETLATIMGTLDLKNK